MTRVKTYGKMAKNEILKNLRRKEEMKVHHEKGITLLALIITVVIMIILAGVTINVTIGERGIINSSSGRGRDDE